MGTTNSAVAVRRADGRFVVIPPPGAEGVDIQTIPKIGLMITPTSTRAIWFIGFPWDFPIFHGIFLQKPRCTSRAANDALPGGLQCQG